MASKNQTVIDQLRSAGGMLDSSKVCALLGMTQSGLLKLTKAGKIPHYRLGDRIKFDPVVLASWVDERRIG